MTLTILLTILLLCIALGMLALGNLRGQRTRRHRRGVLAGNIGEGTREFDSLVPDVNIPYRFLLAKRGSSTLNFTLPAATTDRPIGVCDDQSSTEAIGATPGLSFRIDLLGVGARTKRVAIQTTVNQDDTLVSDGTGFAKTLPTAAGSGTFWIIGVACTAGAASDDPNFPSVIEFIGQLPSKVTL